MISRLVLSTQPQGAVMIRKTILLENPLPDQKEWVFNVPQDQLELRRHGKPSGKIFGKRITFTATAITLEIAELPNNRILQDDDPSKFIAVSFGGLRFPDTFLRVTAEYIQRLMEAGLYLNGVQYRFYHHSNSQLRERSCFMRVANSDAELDTRIYALGEFKKINNIAKRAKRIGLLFSGASLDFKLDPRCTLDIPDITIGETVFSDGCGLMARCLAIQVAKAKGIKFRNKRYTPTIFQIRYLGYKGVLMLHPQLEKHLVHFRKSMKKFNTNTTNTFSVVDYSTPYAFGRLNNDIIVLLSSLGVTNDKLLAKQEEYFQWIEDAATNALRAVDFLSCLGRYEDAERVLLDGLDDPKVFEKVQGAQKSEITKFRKGESEKIRTRMIIHKSRLIYGVCDPYGVLKEGQVHVRITTENGAQTLINASLLVVRNPCLHPGDCLKLRAVHHPSLAHLIDCIVFAGVARPDHPSAPSMSSGGDLDGDRYFVCWDPDIVPPTVVESYDYPPNKERTKKDITRKDLATHFAMYNNSGLARVAVLHQKWLRFKPEGALSPECQELNALHSQSVDGARIKIPDRLSTPPETNEPFILDLLADAAETFSKRFCESLPVYEMARDLPKDDAMLCIRQLLRGERRAFSEFEMFNMAVVIARKRGIDLRPMLPYLDFGALTAEQKHVVSSTLGLTPEEDRYVWNSLLWSDILTDRDLEQRNLKARIPLQRFYSSKNSGLKSFWQYLKMCLHDFTRKVLILKVDNRFGIGIFIRGEIPWDEDVPVNDNRRIVVCSFMPSASGPMSTYRPCSTNYRLYVGNNSVQLFAKQRGDTFVFINRPPEASGDDVITSIALQKISVPVQRQMGRVNRSPVTGIELHVISNRDRVAHQLFDLYFEHVATEAYISRLAQQKLPYTLNNLEEVEWSEDDRMWIRELFIPRATKEKFQSVLENKEIKDVEKVLALSLDHHASYELFWAFSTIIIPIERMNVDVTRQWIEKHPPLVYCLLQTHPPTNDGFVSPYLVDLELTIIQSVIKSANQYGDVSLVTLEKVAASVGRVSMDDYLHLLMLASFSARSSGLIQEILLVLHECREDIISQSPLMEYAHKHALGIMFDRSEEAADECPCNDLGQPKRVRGRGPPPIVRLFPVPGDPTQAVAHVRVDQPTPVRIHSHVRLQAVSDPEKGWVDGKAVVDAVVVMAKAGEMRMELQYPLPPEFAQMQWRMYNAGSVATARAMMDAVRRLVSEGSGCCSFSNLIVGKHQSGTDIATEEDSDAGEVTNDDDCEEHGLNPNQVRAVKSSENPLALVWGPPGTGKTTVVVKILYKLVKALGEDEKILMTASTHNAVDNVLERFIKLNEEENLFSNDKILRVATDNSKVNKELQGFTIDARVGGDMNENNRLVKAALGRVKSARIVFTTCAGAGLGILRKFDFEIAIIDEASQVTEACALIPLVKGCRKAVLVGDHVQLRPMVRNMAKVLLHDVSMLERLYTGPGVEGMCKTMLNMQYRFPQRLAVFPSNEFYQGRLRTAMKDTPTRLAVLKGSKFPWPIDNGETIPVVFLQCGIEEEMTGMSKRNVGQAEVVQYVIKLLTTKDAPEEKPMNNPKDKGIEVDRSEVQKADGTSGSNGENKEKLEITVLTPYTRQVSALKDLVPKDVQVFTIDSFQGRESDIVIFSTVRCNVERDIGFVEDERRLNVMWTRAKLALIIVGDRTTLTAKGLWDRALKSCIDVTLPEDPEITISQAK